MFVVSIKQEQAINENEPIIDPYNENISGVKTNWMDTAPERINELWEQVEKFFQVTEHNDVWNDKTNGEFEHSYISFLGL